MRRFGSREKASRISEQTVRVPKDGAAYMLTAGKEYLEYCYCSNVGVATDPLVHGSNDWGDSARLELVAEADFIDLTRNLSFTHLLTATPDARGYTRQEIELIFRSILREGSAESNKWRIYSFQIKSGMLVFRLIRQDYISGEALLEVSFTLDHLAGQTMQFGFRITHPWWQFWKQAPIISIICDLSDLPKKQKIAVITSDGRGCWREVHRIIYEANFPKGVEKTAENRKFFAGRAHILTRTLFANS